MANKRKAAVKWWVTVVAGLAFIVAVVGGGKMYMDRKALERSYQDGMQQVQETFTEYLIENYAGIEAIEWQGVGVEWRGSLMHGPSMFGDNVISDVKVYVDEQTYFTMDLYLHDCTDYDSDLRKYVLNDSLTPEAGVNVVVEVGLRNAVHLLDGNDKRRFDSVVESKGGSPNAKVTYDLEIHELKY